MKDSRPSAAILAIGTELTTGQVINRNASWISEKLTSLGIEVSLHEIVPDDRELILKSLERCVERNDVLFITGGLGPTADDFTREVISEWMGQPLQFQDPSWQKIIQRLTKFGVSVAESNRQQCFFPPSATVIENPEGTANAFYVKHQDTHTWVLPGPPNEVTAVWESGQVEGRLKELFPHLPVLKLFTWQCLGKSEAELGELVEKTLQNSELKTGYRAHRPYIEIKVWCPEEKLGQSKNRLENLEKALTPWIITRGGEDLLETFLKELHRSDEIEIFDCATGGVLGERLGKGLRDEAHRNLAKAISLSTEWTEVTSPTHWIEDALSRSGEETLTLAIAGFTDAGEWALGARDGNFLGIETLPLPWKVTPQSLERIRSYATELSLKRWTRWMKRCPATF